MQVSWKAAAAALVTLLLVLPAEGAARAPEEDVEIVDAGEMSNWGYSPSSLTVSVGSTVTWKNSGSHTHSVTSQDQLFDSKLLDGGKSWSHTFETPGTYRYFCVPYPWMKGTIVVAAAEEPTPRPSRESGGSSGSTGGAGSSGGAVFTGSASSGREAPAAGDSGGTITN